MLTDHYVRIPVASVQVNRDARHRRRIDTTGLKESIAQRGVINPIIIDRDYVLVAGERRLTASIELGLPDIPARFVEDLSALERQIIELEENVKRSDLSWEETSKAVLHIHQIYEGLEPEWNAEKTAAALGMSPGTVSMHMKVGQELLRGNQSITSAESSRQAWNTINRAEQRRDQDLIHELVEHIKAPEKSNAANGSNHDQSILEGDFREWAAGYTGTKFNFLHCDFPYGINIHDSDQAGTQRWGESYDDKPETYWELLEVLATYGDKFLSPSCHMMFWFSMDLYIETMDFFSRRMPDWEFQRMPLFWHKTDNRGILPDPKRGPRRIVETALIGTRGDRFIVKPVANAYGCPTSKIVHQSEKPEPMLRHFFQMFVDAQSRMLDPTCGGGSALRAAESLGAASVLGIERNPTYATGARRELEKFRALRRVAE